MKNLVFINLVHVDLSADRCYKIIIRESSSFLKVFYRVIAKTVKVSGSNFVRLPRYGNFNF